MFGSIFPLIGFYLEPLIVILETSTTVAQIQQDLNERCSFQKPFQFLRLHSSHNTKLKRFPSSPRYLGKGTDSTADSDEVKTAVIITVPSSRLKKFHWLCKFPPVCNGEMEAVNLRFETAKALTKVAKSVSYNELFNSIDGNSSETKDGNALISFLAILSNEDTFNNESDIFTSKELQDQEKFESTLKSTEVVELLQKQFYLQHIDFDMILHEKDGGQSIINSRKSIFNDIKPSITELDSFGAWRCIINQNHDDTETMISQFQQSLLGLQDDLLFGSRFEYTVVDANYMSDDINSVRWKSVTTLIPSYHVFRDNDMNVCCIISSVSKSFLKRLADLHIRNIERICDESIEQQNNRFLSAGGAALSRRNGQSFLVKGSMGMKLLNLALLELLYELIVFEGQHNRSLPVLLSASYFPCAQRVPTNFTWLQNESILLNNTSNLIQVKTSFRISGILHPSCVSRCIEKIKGFSKDINNPRKSTSTFLSARYSTGYNSLEKDPVWSSLQSNSLLSSYRETVAPVKPLTKLAQLNQRSRIDNNLKDPFLSVMSKDTISKIEESSGAALSNTQKKRFSLKRKYDASDSGTNDNRNVPNCEVVLKLSYFRRLPHFSLVSMFIQGNDVTSQKKKMDILDISQLIWQSQNNEVYSKNFFLREKEFDDEAVKVVKKKNFIMSLQPIDYASLFRSNRVTNELLLVDGMGENWLEEEFPGEGGDVLEPLKNYSNPFVDNSTF